jgi:hypothetical protein
VDTQAGIDKGKGKKCLLASFDSNNGDVGTTMRLVVDDADIEMANGLSA